MGFFNAFLQGPYTSADAAEIAKYQPLLEWWRLASTAAAAGGSEISQDLGNPAGPREQLRLAHWANRIWEANLARVGAGGPGLSSAAFNHGISVLRTTMQDTHVATLEFERNRAIKTFSDHHGEALAQKLHRLCSVERDDDLPPVHALLVKSGKGRASVWCTKCLVC